MENERLARLEEKLASISQRLDKTETKIQTIYDLATAVQEIAIETKEMRKDFNTMDNRIKVIEEKPAKRWDNVINQIISLVVAGVVGFLISKIK